MNNLRFIANKMLKYKGARRSVSRPAVRIAIAGIAIGMAVMLLAIAVVVGFKQEVRRQVIGFGSHIQLSSVFNYTTQSDDPISISSDTERALNGIAQISDVQHIAQQPCILKCDDEFQSVLLKGVDSTYNWTFFNQNIVAGVTLPFAPDTIKNPALISSTIANNMQLRLGDSFVVYFFKNNLRARKFTIVGIYQTTFSEYDKLYIVTPIPIIQRINGWQSDEYTHLELLVRDYSELNTAVSKVFDCLLENEPKAKDISVDTIRSLTPQIFSWLDMLDINAVVILVLMMLVSGFCIISGLLILILERRSTIGLFKALGAKNTTIQRIFLFLGWDMIARGMLIGNVVGLLIIAIQYFTHIIPLDATEYYVSYVPVSISITTLLILNIAIASISMLILIVPSSIVSHISPSQAMRRD